MSLRSRALAATVVLLAVGLVAGCGGSDSAGGAKEKTAAQRLDTARTTLQKTKGVSIVLKTSSLPKGTDGILKAEGTGTDAPAFEGSITAVLKGLSGNFPVTAVDGKTYVKLFGGPSREIDPDDFGVPDPASLFGKDGQLAGLLSDVKKAKKGKDVRDGKSVYSTITGEIPGSQVSGIFPGADDGAFDATFTLDDDDTLVKASVKGDFYGKSDGALTYSVTFSKYGKAPSIMAP